jgi:hypothetical protein
VKEISGTFNSDNFLNRYQPVIVHIIEDFLVNATPENFQSLTEEPKSVIQSEAPVYRGDGLVIPFHDGFSPLWASKKPVDSSRKEVINYFENGRRIIFFVVGGMTVSEIESVHRLTSTFQRGMLIGSTSIITPDEFVKELCKIGEQNSSVIRLPSVLPLIEKEWIHILQKRSEKEEKKQEEKSLQIKKLEELRKLELQKYLSLETSKATEIIQAFEETEEASKESSEKNALNVPSMIPGAVMKLQRHVSVRSWSLGTVETMRPDISAASSISNISSANSNVSLGVSRKRTFRITNEPAEASIDLMDSQATNRYNFDEDPIQCILNRKIFVVNEIDSDQKSHEPQRVLSNKSVTTTVAPGRQKNSASVFADPVVKRHTLGAAGKVAAKKFRELATLAKSSTDSIGDAVSNMSIASKYTNDSSQYTIPPRRNIPNSAIRISGGIKPAISTSPLHSQYLGRVNSLGSERESETDQSMTDAPNIPAYKTGNIYPPYQPEPYQPQQYQPQQYQPQQYQPQQYQPQQYQQEQYQPQQYQPEQYQPQHYQPQQYQHHQYKQHQYMSPQYTQSLSLQNPAYIPQSQYYSQMARASNLSHGYPGSSVYLPGAPGEENPQPGITTQNTKGHPSFTGNLSIRPGGSIQVPPGQRIVYLPPGVRPPISGRPISIRPATLPDPNVGRSYYQSSGGYPGRK